MSWRPPSRSHITGLVLAGGEGRRMGQEKGLALLEGEPLAARALRRLRPQVGHIALNANRSLPAYKTLAAPWHAPIWPDLDPDRPAGPLAGLLSGLTHCATDWLLTVPCDVPHFPLDLVEQLVNGLCRHPARPLATVSAPSLPDDTAEAPAQPDLQAQRQPVFCLAHRSLKDDLQHYLASGERRVGRWMDRHQVLEVAISPNQPQAWVAHAFANANTPEALHQLGKPPPRD